MDPTEQEKADLKKWAEQWKITGQRLEEIRRQELRDPEYRKKIESMGSLLNWVCANAETRTTSGLVEQQYYFRKLWKKMNPDHD